MRALHLYFSGLVSILVLLSFWACRGDTPENNSASGEDCRVGKPEAIFKADDPGVVSHTFVRDGQISTETIDFAKDTLLIYQEGCDLLKQTFVIGVTDSVRGWSQFRNLAVNRLTTWARLDRRLFGLDGYARAVRAVPEDFPQGQSADLAPGLTLRAYPVPGESSRRWHLEIQQVLPETQVERLQ